MAAAAPVEDVKAESSMLAKPKLTVSADPTFSVSMLCARAWAVRLWVCTGVRVCACARLYWADLLDGEDQRLRSVSVASLGAQSPKSGKLRSALESNLQRHAWAAAEPTDQL